MNEIMKRVRGSLMVLGIAMFAMTGLAATNDVSGMLQKGLFEEEANRNLDAAIQAYQSVIAQTDKERKFAATAIFRLGECYRKLGKTNEATAQYERIVREFSDQAELMKLSQGYIGTGEKNSVTNGAIANQPQTIAKGAVQPALSEEDQKIEQLQKMIKDSPDLINAQVNGTGPLNRAAEAGQLKVVKFLLDNKADVEAKNRMTGQTPLIAAAESGNREMVDLLLDNGADVNAFQTSGQNNNMTQMGFTALHKAASRGYRAIAEDLIAHKANVNATSQYGLTPLHLAAEKGFRSVAEMLLADGAEVNLGDASGVTPLHQAVGAKNKAIVELLLANRADVNSRTVQGETPLFASASNGDAEIAKMLLAHEADINAPKNDGMTPLMAAVSHANKPLVELLLSEGAHVNAKTEDQYTALGVAIGRPEMTALVLRYKPQLEILDKDGYTPLQRAVLNGWLKDTEQLLDAGANVNAPLAREYGASPLILAVQRRNKEMVTLLLEHKADVNQQDNGGGTAISHAKLFVSQNANSVELEKMDKVIEMLRKAGANENLRRLAAIGISREDFKKEIFFKGTNAYNNYTLFELIARAYTPEAWVDKWTAKDQEPPGLRFPDFTKITINRLEEDGRTNTLKLNLEAALNSGDCTKDIPLKWGDIVEIPELDHSVTALWRGLPDKVAETLVKCLERTVTIIVKGKPTNVFLFPNLFPTYRNSSTFGGAAFGTPDSIRLPTFWLPNVVSDANVLLASSDLTRVKVKRTDPATKQSKEFVFDLKASVQKRQSPQNKRKVQFPVHGVTRMQDSIEESEPYMSAGNLWLRDGDVIEIPEKQP